MIRTKLTALALTAGLFAASCMGPNAAFNGLKDWNQDFTDKDWVNECVFVGLHLIPVYELAYLVDIIGLNTVEYWSK